MNEKNHGLALRCLTQVRLPKTENEGPGLLHTVVRDDYGNLYYSDEINHTVTSLDQSGGLRWHRGGKGSVPGKFSYPRGISLGLCQHNGSLQRCICVCDAWNNRVQLLDTDGDYLCSWVRAGNLKFDEVCDVCYVTGQSGNQEAYWLFLDRGNNRLCAVGLDGQSLFQIGHAFTPSLEMQWGKHALEPLVDPAPEGIAHDFCTFDPLFFPTRILGSTETALFVYEPNSGRLKQPFLGNLYPLTIRLPLGAEWIAADEDFYLAWSAPSQCLRWFDAAGSLLCEVSAQGRPVASDLPVHEVWMHVDDQLHLCRIDRESLRIGLPSGTMPFQALWRSAMDEFAASPSDISQSSCNELLAATDAALELCDDFLKRAWDERSDVLVLKGILERFLAAQRRFAECSVRFNEAVHPLFLAAQKYRLLSQCSRRDAIELSLEAAERLLRGHTRPVVSRLLDALQRLDEITHLRRCLWKIHPDVSAYDPTLVTQHDVLYGIIHELRRWSGTGFGATDLLALPNAGLLNRNGKAQDRLLGDWIRRPVNRPEKALSRCLRETDRIPVATSSLGGIPSKLSCLARTSNGHYFVGQQESGSLVHLDETGRFLGEMFGPNCRDGALSGPVGIAADKQDRLWIVECHAQRVRIVDPRTEEQRMIGGSRDEFDSFSDPIGICIGPPGAMLVADSGNDRVAAIVDCERVTTFTGRSGTGPGEFRYPLSLCADGTDPSAGFWVVDERNHRVQKFDVSGHFLQQVGGFGLYPDSLVFPNQVAQFPDGILVVSQARLERCLKLFSPRGQELDRMYLDYIPGGIVVGNGFLAVTEWYGRHIRLYQRR